MTRRRPQVRKYMTRIPHEAERCSTVAEAVEVMQTHAIRHIPVMKGAHVAGIVSERDVLTSRIKFGSKLDAMPLEDICQKDVLCVNPMTPVDEVARRLLGRKVGSAVVLDGDFLVGIFTTTDALRVLKDVFSS